MRATVTEKFLSKLRRAAYRRSYVSNEVRMSLAHQIIALREQRGWSQKDLADRMGTQQSVISRLENPDYGRVSLKTIIKVADAFDVGFVGRYCSFPEMIFRSKDVTAKAFFAESFSEEQFSTAAKLPADVQVFGAKPISVAAKDHVTFKVLNGSAFSAVPA